QRLRTGSEVIGLSGRQCKSAWRRVVKGGKIAEQVPAYRIAPAPDQDGSVQPPVAVSRGMDGGFARSPSLRQRSHHARGPARSVALRPTLSSGLPFRG